MRADAGDGGFDYLEATAAGERTFYPAPEFGEEGAAGGASRSRRPTSRFHHSEFVEDFETDEDDVIPSEYSEFEEESIDPTPAPSSTRGASSEDKGGLKEELQAILEDNSRWSIPPAPVFPAPGLAARGPLKLKLNLTPGQKGPGQQHPSTQQAQHGSETTSVAPQVNQNNYGKLENCIQHPQEPQNEETLRPSSQDPLAMLAGIVAEGDLNSALASPPSAPLPIASSKPSLVILYRSLLRNEAGQVNGARLGLHFPRDSREPSEICKNLCEFGVENAAVLEIDDMNFKIEQCTVELVLRLVEAGQVGPLEATIAKLLKEI